MSLLVASQLVDKDMDDTEEGEILEDGEIADEDESTGGDHKTASPTVTTTTTTTTDTHTLQIDNKERRHDSENRRSEDRNRDKDNNNRGPEARDRARERRERHERQERERKSSSIDRDRKTSVGEDERRRKERELRNSDRKRRRSDEDRDERERDRDRDDRQRDDRRKRLRDQNWDEFNNENNNRNTTYDGFPRRPFEDFDFRLPAEPSHGFSSSGPHERDRFEDEEMFDEQEFEDMLQMMEQRMPPRVGAMSLMEKKAMMKTMMTMMSRMDPDKSRRFARLRERRRTNDQPTGAPPGPRPPIRPLDHRPPNSFKPLCKYFLDGKCHKGADCPFSHDANPPKKKELCKFYLQGFCGKGEDCLFMHGEFPCKFFHTNVECYSGDNCRFSHAPLTEQTREILRNYLDSGTLPDDPKPDRYHRSHTNADSDNRNKSQTDSHNQNNTSDKNESNPDNCDTSAGQSSGFAPVKPVAKRHAVLGDVTTEMKKSYLTWVWQQEMKELEIAYVGNKRNLFCIEKPFVMTEKPTTPRMEDDEEEIEEQIRNYYRDTMPEMEIPEDVGDVDHRIPIDTPVAAIQVPAVNPEEQMLIEMSAHDEDLRTLMMPRPRSHTNESMPPMTGDIDERSAVMVTEAIEQPMPMPADLPQNVPTTARELYYKMQNRIANRLQTESEKSLDYQSDSDDDDRNVLAAALKNVQQSSANKSPSSSDKISQMLAAIRNNTAANQSPKQEFWQNFMSGFNMPGGSPQAGGSTPPKSEYRDPRLKRGKESMSPSIDTTPPVKICDPNVKIEYKLIAIKVPEIDYSTYVSLYRIDGRLKNDPRLNKFFSKLPTSEIDNLSRIVPPPLKTAPVTPLSVLKSKKKSEKERQKEKITPERSDKEGSPTLPPLPPLTISPSKSATTPGIFPPTPPPIMSPLELISSRPTYTVSDNKSSHIKAEPLDVFALSKNGHQRRDSTDSKADEKTLPPPLLLSHRRRSSSSSYSPPKLSEPIKSPVKSPTDKTADPLPCYVPSSVESILKNSFSYSTDATDRKPINPFMALTSNPSSLSSSSLTKELYESSFDKSIDSSDVKTDNDKEEQMETSSNSSEDLYENLNLFQLITAEKDIKPKLLSSPRSSIDELELIRTELKAPPMTMTSIDSSDNEMEIDLRRRTDSVSEVESADECELMIASSSEPEDNNNEPEVVNHYLKLPKNESKEVNVISSSDEPINSSSDQTTEASNQLTDSSNVLTEPLTEVTDKPTDLSNDSSDQKPETSDPLVTNSVESEPQNKELDSESKVLSANEAVDETATDQPMNLIVSETPVTEAEAELEPQVTESCDQSLKSVFSTIDPTASPFC